MFSTALSTLVLYHFFNDFCDCVTFDKSPNHTSIGTWFVLGLIILLLYPH